MKRIQLFGFALAMLFGAGIVPAVAQNYYPIGTTIQGNGFTYISEPNPGGLDSRYPRSLTRDGMIRVRSVNNRLTDVPPMLNGQPLSIVDDRQTIAGENKNSLAVMYNAAWAVMTPTDRQNAMNENLLIYTRIDRYTGKTLEVEFLMDPYKNGFIRIAPEKLYAVEKALKDQVVFQITPFGRSLNFVTVLLSFRGRDIGAYYDFGTGTWYDPGVVAPPSTPGTTGIDFVLTNNTGYTFDIVSVALWGMTGDEYTAFIDCSSGRVPIYSSLGLPTGRGLDVSASPGAPITDLGLEFYLTPTYIPPAAIQLTAWIEGTAGPRDSEVVVCESGSMLLTYLELPGSATTVPSSGRLTLHIEVSDAPGYSPWRAPMLPAAPTPPAVR